MVGVNIQQHNNNYVTWKREFPFYRLVASNNYLLEIVINIVIFNWIIYIQNKESIRFCRFKKPMISRGRAILDGYFILLGSYVIFIYW